MKKIITILISIFFSGILIAQNKYTYPLEIGKVSVSNGQITLVGSTSGSVVLKSNVAAGTGTIFQFPANNGTNTYVLQTNGSGITSWVAPATGTLVAHDTTHLSIRINNKLASADSSSTLGKKYATGKMLKDGLALKLDAADSIEASTIVPFLTDTIPLVTFGIGSGATADTACFNDDRLIGTFYNEGSDTLVVTQLMGILSAGTGTETIAVQISWHTTLLSGSATSLNATALAITSHTTGTEDVAFTNAKIPPNVFVWGILSGASSGNKPTFLSVTLSGYKIPKY